MPVRLSPWWPVLLALIAVGAPAAALAAMDPTPAGMLALLLILAASSALVSVDERALGPLVFHEPLVASGVAGLLAGVPGAGILIGLTLQLIWPGLRPLGGSRLPTPGLAALVGLAWYLFLPDESGPWHLTIALGAAMGAAAWGRAAEDVLRRRNAQRERRTDAHGKHLWRGEWLAAAGAAEAIARGPLAIGLLVGLPLVALRWVASEPRGLAAFSSFFMPLDSRGWSELIPPDPALAGVWFFAAGGLLRLVFRAARGARGGGRGGDDPRAEPGGAPAVIGVPPGGDQANRSARGGRIGPALWVRLLLLQAGFSDAYLQRSGFIALSELLCRGRAGGSTGPESGIEADLAQARALNTHPAMAAALAGALGRGIHGCDAGVAGRPVSRLLEVGGASLAQYGDRLFWGGARPLLALTATAIAPVAPLAGVGIFLGAGLILELGSRVALHGWGARVGWAVATGLQGRFWREAPAWTARAQIWAGLAVLAALAIVASPQSHPPAWALRLGWFMLGILAAGMAARRAMVWGWMCWGASLVGAALTAFAPGLVG